MHLKKKKKGISQRSFSGLCICWCFIHCQEPLAGAKEERREITSDLRPTANRAKYTSAHHKTTWSWQDRPNPALTPRQGCRTRHCSCLGRVGIGQETGRCFGRSRSCQIGSRERTQDTICHLSRKGRGTTA